MGSRGGGTGLGKVMWTTAHIPGVETRAQGWHRCTGCGWVRNLPVPKVLVLWEARDQYTDRLLRHDGIITTK